MIFSVSNNLRIYETLQQSTRYIGGLLYMGAEAKRRSLSLDGRKVRGRWMT